MNVSLESEPSYVTAWRPFSSQSHQAAPDATAWLCTEVSVNNSSTPPLKKQRVNPSLATHIGFSVSVCRCPEFLLNPHELCGWNGPWGCTCPPVGWVPVVSHLCFPRLPSRVRCCPCFRPRWSILVSTAGCGQKTVLGKRKKVGQTALVWAEISSPPLNPTRNAFLLWTASWLPWLPTYYSTS